MTVHFDKSPVKHVGQVIDQILDEVNAEFLAGRRHDVTPGEIADEVYRRLPAYVWTPEVKRGTIDRWLG